MKKKKRLLGVLLSLVLVLGLMPGMSLTAYATATEYTSLKQGDVLHVGDTINSTTEYNTGTGGWLNPNSPYTLVRADVSSSSGETHYDMVVTESATGAYYLLKGNVSGSDYYLGARITNPTNGDLQCYWPVTGTSDGISVTAVNVEQYSTEVTFAVHEVVAVTGVTLNPSTAQTINVDGKVSFTATVQPEDASEKKVKWSVVGTNSGAVKLYSDVDCKTEVGTDAVETLTVYAKGMSVGKATVKVESNADSNKSASCDVTVNEPTTADTYSVTITPSSNMTIGSNTGAATQTGLSGAMDEVVYTADDGYYFPENYSVATVNGISVTRNSYTQITVSGTPTANAAITLTAPTAKTTPAAPATAAAVDCTTADNNDGKLIGVTTAMEYKKWDDENWKVGTGSDITGLINGTYFVRLKETDTENASANQELTIAEYVAPVVTEYPLWVGGVQVTSANASNITEVSTPTASYDVTTNTLILNNANITSGYQFQDGWGKAGIYYEDKNNSNALNIVVRGANIISGDDIGIGMCGGYYYYGKLNFSGDGTLTTRGASSGIYMRNGGVQIDSGTIEASGTSSTGINAKGGITINGGNVEAMGANYGIQTMYGVKITGGTVTAQATNSTSDTGSAIYDGSSNGISITGGTVTATGISSSSKAYGLYVGSSGNIQIGSEITSLTVTGTTSASSGTVKNSVAGMGWITVDGTGDGTEIAINTSGASLSSYKKLLFPYTKSASTVKTTPNAKTLTYTGTAQELVTAGTAENGTMQYALGTDDKTEPTSGWSTSIPTGNEAKTYFVWYKAVGAAGFSDSAAACIKVTISNPYTPPVKPKPTTDTEEYTIPVENNNAVDVGAAIESGTAVINEITEEDLSKVTSNDNIGGNGNTPGSGTGDNSQIVIDLSGAKQEVVACELTKQSFKNLADTAESNSNQVDSVKIQMTNATVELDGKALNAIADQATGSSIKLVVEDTQQTRLNQAQQNALSKYSSVTSFEAYFESNGARIHNFKGGTATVSMKFKPDKGRDINFYHVFYLDPTGKMVRYITKYINQMLMFITGHFSDYAIVYDETLKNATEEADNVKQEEDKTGDNPENSNPENSNPENSNPSGNGTTAEDASNNGNGNSSSPENSTKDEKPAEDTSNNGNDNSNQPDNAMKDGNTANEETQPSNTEEEDTLALNGGLKVSQSGTTIKVAWGKVKGAGRYEVYATYCGSKFKNSVKTVSGSKDSVTIKKLNGKKIDLTKNYKVYVVAYKASGTAYIKTAKSITAHIVGAKNTRFSNVKSISLSKKKFSLKEGSTATLKASCKLVDPKKRMLSDAHAPTFRYASTDKNVATVSSKGKITAKGKGTCYVYVYAKNGYAKKAKVTVK